MKKRLLIVLSLAGTCFSAFAQNPGIISRDLSKEHNTTVSVTESHRVKSNDSRSAILSPPRDLSKEINTTVSMAESHRTSSSDSRSTILLPPDTTKMVSGSSRIALMTEQGSVKTKTSTGTLGRVETLGHWRASESGNDN